MASLGTVTAAWVGNEYVNPTTVYPWTRTVVYYDIWEASSYSDVDKPGTFIRYTYDNWASYADIHGADAGPGAPNNWRVKEHLPPPGRSRTAGQLFFTYSGQDKWNNIDWRDSNYAMNYDADHNNVQWSANGARHTPADSLDGRSEKYRAKSTSPAVPADSIYDNETMIIRVRAFKEDITSIKLRYTGNWSGASMNYSSGWDYNNESDYNNSYAVEFWYINVTPAMMVSAITNRDTGNVFLYNFAYIDGTDDDYLKASGMQDTEVGGTDFSFDIYDDDTTAPTCTSGDFLFDGVSVTFGGTVTRSDAQCADGVSLQNVNITDSSGLYSAEHVIDTFQPTPDAFESVASGDCDDDGFNFETVTLATSQAIKVRATDNDYDGEAAGDRKQSGWITIGYLTVTDDDTAGPVIGTPSYPASVPANVSCIVTVDISDAVSATDNGTTKLYYGYTAPYNQNSVDETSGSGNGVYTFTIPPQLGHAGETLYFYIVAADDDNDRAGDAAASTNDNAGSYFALSITTQPTEPVLAAPTATNIGATNATLGATITSDGGKAVTARGTMWSAGAPPPTNSTAEGGSGIGTFSHERTGLPPATEIYYCGWASNEIGVGYSPTSTFWTLSLEPSSHAASFMAAPASDTSVNLSWGGASGEDGFIILSKQGSAPTGMPADATAYSVGNTVGDATVAYIASAGGAGNATVGSLSPATEYYFAIFPYAWDGSHAETYNYRTSAGVPVTNATTFAAEPTLSASGVSFAQVQENSLYVSWTSGNGSARIVVVREGGAVSWTPADGSNYTANSDFSAAGDQGGGNKVVYNGSGNDFTLSGLTAGVTYYVAVYEYNAGPNYKTTAPGTGSKMTSANPSGQSAADGYEMVDLAWQPNATYNTVMIVHRVGSAPGSPTQGQAYNVGESCGDGTVIYKGTGTNAEHVVAVNSANYYKFFTVVDDYYSSGMTTSVNTGDYLAHEIVEPFAYSNGAALGGKSGGHGFSGAWSAGGSQFTNEAGSFADITGCPANHGNKVVVSPPAGATRVARRPFAAVTSGKLYVSFIMNYQFSGATKWAGVSLMHGTTEKVFFGEIYSQDQTLGVCANGTDTASSYNLSAGVGNDYLVVGKYDFSTRELKVKGYWKTDTVPTVEPLTWDASTVLSAGYVTQLDGVRLGAGADSGMPGNTYFDELRVGTNWLDVVGVFAPITQASGITFNNVLYNQMGVAWTRGSGAGCLVVARAGASVSGDPLNETAYTASAAYGSGSPLGGGYVVYNGSGNSFTLTNLKDSTVYYLRVYEWVSGALRCGYGYWKSCQPDDGIGASFGYQIPISPALRREIGFCV